ncbi:patatin-like phospholipase family protein [Sphingomonas morindae]|uniref:Patatin-like phospholipase family protein n=1 Tax=Sphingomonas morindae TaxID=1541170 RepID=A0ABY4XCM3_9SPHN|nr:patatin-like phospholipase family protein [Sphingomonas morindae]USI74420.1 patatin-like phospholipase family protein [Sphingomonas morindae]
MRADPPPTPLCRPPAALVLGGGVALGAYHLGAIERLDAALDIQAVAGASIGAITAALFAGNAPDARLDRLRRFWTRVEEAPPWPDPLGLAAHGPWRHWRNWASAATARLGGVPGLFRPRAEPGAWLGERASLYDQSPLADTLAGLIDADRLRAGAMRCCIATTDIETAELVLFDSAAGDAIAIPHILASCALLPSFAPVRIGDRLLGDGGLSANCPFEPFLAPDRRDPAPPLVVLLDLFAPDATPPTSIEAAAARSTEVQFAAQSRLRLDAIGAARAAAGGAATRVLALSYRAPGEEAGPERQFDFSARSRHDRAAAGRRDAEAALAHLATLPPLAGHGLELHRIAAPGRGAATVPIRQVTAL